LVDEEEEFTIKGQFGLRLLEDSDSREGRGDEVQKLIKNGRPQGEVPGAEQAALDR